MYLKWPRVSPGHLYYLYLDITNAFFKMDFRRRPFNQKPLVFGKSPRTHLEVQGSFGDEATFQECRKSWILWNPLFGKTENWRPGVYFDAEYVSALSCHAKTAWIAIWSKQKHSRKSSFSVFRSIGPVFSLFESQRGAWLQCGQSHTLLRQCHPKRKSCKTQ